MSTDLPAADASPDRSDVRPRQLGEGPMTAPREPAIESDVLDRVVVSLRRRAEAIRASAIRNGVSIIDVPFAVVRTSEAVQRLRVAADLEKLAADLESGSGG
jgi:hypothetical protein